MVSKVVNSQGNRILDAIGHHGQEQESHDAVDDFFPKQNRVLPQNRNTHCTQLPGQVDVFMKLIVRFPQDKHPLVKRYVSSYGYIT